MDASSYVAIHYAPPWHKMPSEGASTPSLTVLEVFLNDLQFLTIRPMPTPGFGAGHNFYAGFEFAVANTNNWYEIPNQPKRRPSPDAYGSRHGIQG